MCNVNNCQQRSVISLSISASKSVCVSWSTALCSAVLPAVPAVITDQQPTHFNQILAVCGHIFIVANVTSSLSAEPLVPDYKKLTTQSNVK